MDSSSAASSTSTFPILVVTSPDATAARAAQEGPLELLFDASTTTSSTSILVSTHDPYNTKCGSGGGTVAAIMLAASAVDQQQKQQSMLIIHAGGDSSRCPTQMVLGKSWTTLPLSNDNNNATSSMQSPTSILVKTLSHLLKGIPKGSVVVAASDTLLQLPLEESNGIDWTCIPVDDAILGVTVPAPLDTAKNHGVYVLNDNDSDSIVQPVAQVLQKPSIESMREQGAKETAWIDTGIVIFPPKAAQALRELAQAELKACCWEGLKELHQESSSEQEQTVEQFAQEHALKVDMYTHMLMALKVTSDSTTEEAYLQRFPDDSLLPQDVLRGIYRQLSSFQMFAVVISNGQFLHLGTSKELVNFIVQGSSKRDDDDNDSANNGCRSMGRDLKLVSTYNSLLSQGSKPYEQNDDFVSYNSLVQTSASLLSIGRGTVLEHVHVTTNGTSLQIGSDCLISGWRGDYTTTTSDDPIVIPPKTCLQIMPLLHVDNNNEEQEEQDSHAVVVMCFGMEDDIKDWTTVYNIETATFMKATGLTPKDLWDDNVPHLLWTAKLHPVVVSGSAPDLTRLLYSWLSKLNDDSSSLLKDDDDLAYFRSCPRLSLHQVRKQCDANAEWKYRYNLERLVIPLHVNLWNRQHVECPSLIGAKNIHGVMQVLEEVCKKAILTKQFDICGRSFMVASAALLLSSADRSSSSSTDTVQLSRRDEMQTLVRNLRNNVCTETCQELFASCTTTTTRDDDSCNEASSSSSLALEQAASIMTELCVCGSVTREPPTFARRSVMQRTTNDDASWVVSTAPARVDLSGGWSDTPPVCYEYGGAVAGLAVLVDGQRPLSCRSRLVPGGTGIRVCTESRDPKTGTLHSSTEAMLLTVGDVMRDCRDPLADCALLKCALVYLGLIPSSKQQYDEDCSLQPLLQIFHGGTSEPSMGLEIVSTSLLPRGSGMGTSSILAGCVLASIAQCVGIDLGNNDDDDDDDSDNRLIHVVLLLEQLLTCGGGWQDQIGGLVGGFKLGTSRSNEIPVTARVERMPLSSATLDRLNDRLILVFTGHTRLAKNILQNVLRRWARRTPEIVETVQALVRDAHAVCDALKNDKLDTVADCLNRYWQQKKIMAGKDSGVEPPVVNLVLTELKKRGDIVAGSLCGAGGGGFMVLLAAEGKSMDDIKATCDTQLVPLEPNVGKFTWHTCQVATNGLLSTTIQKADAEEDQFDISWHQM